MNKFAGIIGYPLSHSLSPSMHNFIYQKLGIEIVYKKWEIEEQNLKLHIGKINNDDFVGANVTVPYKEKIVPFLDEIKDEAKFTGAVNTIVKNDNKLTGYNTDVYGIEKTLDIKFNPGDANQNYDLLTNEFLKIVNRHAPLKKKIIMGNEAPFMNKILLTTSQ